MPIYANRIVHGTDPDDPADYYPFEDMLGRLQPKQERLEAFVRRGHRGETLRKTGVRGVPFGLVTMHYVLDWAAAKTALLAYADLAEGDQHQIIQHSTNYGWFRVLEVVELPQTRYVANVIGSILQAEQSLLPTVQQWVQWTLLGADAPE